MGTDPPDTVVNMWPTPLVFMLHTTQTRVNETLQPQRHGAVTRVIYPAVRQVRSTIETTCTIYVVIYQIGLAATFKQVSGEAQRVPLTSSTYDCAGFLQGRN